MSFNATRSMKRKNVKGLGLALNAPQTTTHAVVPAQDAQIRGGRGNHAAMDTSEWGVEFDMDLKPEDFVVLKELGAGNGGTVSKVQHITSRKVWARKVIHVEAKRDVRKRIVRELHMMKECRSDYIVAYHGACLSDSANIIMFMEYMDCGSLDNISKKFGPIRVDVLGKIAEAVLGGLVYLYRDHRIMHRDIKPSNILVNSRGCIKLCDFGVSSELENSIANTFVGTGTYMAPERIQGSAYTVKSDVWSFGLTLMELAIGKFPFTSEVMSDDEDGMEGAGPQGILDLLQQIVGEPSPKLPKSDAFPTILESMLDRCLMKDPDQRPTPQDLYEYDPFLQAARNTDVDLEAWASGVMERRRPRVLVDHLRHETSSSTSSSITPTPTSGDIPIALLSLDSETPTESAARPWPVRTSSAQSASAFPVRQTNGSPFNSNTLPLRQHPPEGPLPPVPPKPRTTNSNPPPSLSARDARRYAGLNNDPRTSERRYG